MFAPLILSFTQSVLNEAKEDQTIFFNARDSFIMYVVADGYLKLKRKLSIVGLVEGQIFFSWHRYKLPFNSCK